MDPDSRRRRVEAAASQVRCPVLVVRGEQSDHFHLEDALATAALFSHARTVSIPGAGHTVQGDQPQLLARALRAFLSGR
jgi:pimeloyl-ACP methyl ester carboxylesterase